ncbi:tripartite tricarboxylate transporter TctB family protein [Aminobacterium mobile]
MNPDIVVSLFSIILSALYSFSAWNLPNAPIGSPMAPKLFPLALGGCGMILGLIQLYKGITGHKKDYKKVVFSGKRLNVLIIAVIIAYSYLFERLGFIPSTLLFLTALLSLINGIHRWKINLTVTTCFTIATWYIFERIFYITLP